MVGCDIITTINLQILLGFFFFFFKDPTMIICMSLDSNNSPRDVCKGSLNNELMFN